MAEADRSGRLALGSFVCAVVCLIVCTWHMNESGWWWLFFWASVAFALRTISALEARWFHRTSARVAAGFYLSSKR